MSWTHIEDSTPKARKQHECRICGEAINAGEKHVARRGVGDDGPCTIRLHTACETYSSKFWKGEEWETFSPGQISRDEVEDALRSTLR